jgi:DNA invertase Pin-like site-specific DNA recombinase
MTVSEKRPYRVIVWCAVSSKRQAAEDKISLPAQEQEGREFAEAVGGVTVDVLLVPGHTRDIVLFEDAAREMEAYQQLREHCEVRDFDVLWARDPDRLGRDPALAQTVASLVERADAEVYVASAPHPIGQGGSGHRYVYAMQAVSAGENQRQRKRYHKMGMRRRVEGGLVPCRWPYGYRPVRDPVSGRVVGAELTEDAGAVRMATERFIRGDPYAVIARMLDESVYSPPETDHWNSQTIYQWMQSDTYAGLPSWGEFRASKPSAAFPAIWDETTYQAVLRERENRRGQTNRRYDGGSPFLDVAFCARCGGRMTRAISNAGTMRLRCATHSSVRRTGVGCHPNYIQMDVVRAEVSAYLAGLDDPQKVAAELAEGPDQDRIEARLAEIEKQAAASEPKRKRLALAFASGAMDMEMYRETDDQILVDLSRLEDEAEELRLELAQVVDPEQLFGAIQDVRWLLDEGMDELPGIEVATALRSIGLRLLIEEREVVAIRIG